MSSTGAKIIVLAAVFIVVFGSIGMVIAKDNVFKNDKLKDQIKADYSKNLKKSLDKDKNKIKIKKINETTQGITFVDIEINDEPLIMITAN